MNETQWPTEEGFVNTCPSCGEGDLQGGPNAAAPRARRCNDCGYTWKITIAESQQLLEKKMAEIIEVLGQPSVKIRVYETVYKDVDLPAGTDVNDLHQALAEYIQDDRTGFFPDWATSGDRLGWFMDMDADTEISVFNSDLDLELPEDSAYLAALRVQQERRETREDGAPEDN